MLAEEKGNYAHVEAVRQIVLRILEAKTINQSITIGPVLRQTLFYIYEGGEANKWSRVRPHSVAARSYRDGFSYQKGAGVKGLRYDHAIPLSVIYKGMTDHVATPTAFRDYLRAMVQGVVITDEEDRRLSAAGYRKDVPAGAASSDLMARYRAVGIVLAPADEARLTARISR